MNFRQLPNCNLAFTCNFAGSDLSVKSVCTTIRAQHSGLLNFHKCQKIIIQNQSINSCGLAFSCNFAGSDLDVKSVCTTTRARHPGPLSFHEYQKIVIQDLDAKCVCNYLARVVILSAAIPNASHELRCINT